MTLEVLVLGSGGPFANPLRASSAYLVRVAGGRSLLVDAGGGTFLRLGQERIDPAAIDAVLLTHTHADHSGGLGAVVFAAVMAGGARPLHAKPTEVGRLAAEAGARRLLLSHVMPEHEDELETSLALVRARYDGEILLAADGLRVAA